MKKSLLYNTMQHVVLREDGWLKDGEKLEILRELFVQEDLAKFSEEQEANQA